MTPYSLQKHNYTHNSALQYWKCKKCNKTFTFKSQLKIHRLSHTIIGRYECKECYLTYKYKHDRFKHQCEHMAAIESCDKCDYTGTKLKLKEHKKQHIRKYNITCPYCLQTFIFRMAYWHHKKRCRHSDSPDY